MFSFGAKQVFTGTTYIAFVACCHRAGRHLFYHFLTTTTTQDIYLNFNCYFKHHDTVQYCDILASIHNTFFL